MKKIYVWSKLILIDSFKSKGGSNRPSSPSSESILRINNNIKFYLG